MHAIKSHKKLIEVALPLDDINEAAAREKTIRQGHPSGLHLWWARRPLAAARAVVFAQMVNDPSETTEGDRRTRAFKERVERKREALFEIIRQLVQWENTNNDQVIERAREAIRESWRETCHLNRNHPQAERLFNPNVLPAFHDPFAGGGAIPLEAQRLGMESYASDLNPVAVLINKAMIEIPPAFAGQPPVGPFPIGEKQAELMSDWAGATGLAEDVRRYGHWMREEAFRRIGNFYPKVRITAEIVARRPDLKAYEGEELTVIAWIWARTVKSPSPAFSHADVPLVSSFVLSKKKGKEVYVEPVIAAGSYQFQVRTGALPLESHEGTVGRKGGLCLLSGAPIPLKYIREEGKNGRLGSRLMAVALEGKRGRVYLSPDMVSPPPEIEEIEWAPGNEIEHISGCTNAVVYGLSKFSDLFTSRQLVALNTFSNLVEELRAKVALDSAAAGLADDGKGLRDGGRGATAYADALALILTFSIDKMADLGNSLCGWEPIAQCPRHLFGKQAIPMIWDFAEANPFSESSGSWMTFVDGQSRAIAKNFVSAKSMLAGNAAQADAATQSISSDKVISTDPPYYDNIPYASLSDFFYVWMRRSLRSVYPDLFSTLGVPKAEELVAAPYRVGTKEKAEAFFMEGMTRAINRLAMLAHPAFPVTIYYAFKQSETKDAGTSSAGWVTFLEAVIQAGFSIDGTWPLNTENASRMRGQGSNALASSIVLVCRRRIDNAEEISRRDFQRMLREEMPEALEAMIGGETGQTPIAPVDLAQSAIGPGMAIFSKYGAVLNQDGTRMSVHDALILINRAITDYLNPDGGSFDADTLFCDDWFSQYGWGAGNFGEADTLARAKGTSVDGVRSAGVIESGGGKVRLLRWNEYPADWDPSADSRTPVWEACHQMIRALNQQGESAAGALLARMPEQGEPIRQLAYHLYTLCERKRWAEEARAYNELIGSWHAIVAASHDTGHRDEQIGLGL